MAVADARRRPELHLNEGYINAWGYRLLFAPRPAEAKALFGYNVAEHPDSANPTTAMPRRWPPRATRPGPSRNTAARRSI
jgi:hypothetical protein